MNSTKVWEHGSLLTVIIDGVFVRMIGGLLNMVLHKALMWVHGSLLKLALDSVFV